MERSGMRVSLHALVRPAAMLKASHRVLPETPLCIVTALSHGISIWEVQGKLPMVLVRDVTH